ncbi:MAG: HD superfamily phosphohydrolase, partial [Myxococcota bacterium]
HSMGVAYLARRMYDQLRPFGTSIERLAVVAAALCHDLGHGPFSHVAERIAGYHHEDVTVALISTPGAGPYEVLEAHQSGLAERVAGFYDKNNTDEPLRHIVSSQLDADRIDYILRDGMATGVKIGVFDVERIISMLEVHQGCMCVSYRAVEAVEGYLLARFHMYKQVYLHKASRAAERMLEAAVRRARVLDASGYRFAWFPDGALARLVRGQIDGPIDIPQLDDMDVWYALKRFAQEPDPALAELAGGLVHRRLFKTREIGLGADGDAVVTEARAVARALGRDPESCILQDSSADAAYSPYIPGSGGPDESIRIVQRDGQIVPVEAVSDVIRLLGQVEFRVRRLVAPADVIEAMK